MLLLRAVGLAERGAFAESLTCFEEVLAKAPDNVHAHCAHARLLQQLGDHPRARSALLSALVVQPEHGEALGLLGKSLLWLGDAEQAMECFERATRLVPQNAGAHFDLGQALVSEGKFAAALERLERVTRLEPEFARGWAALGSCLDRLGHVFEAQRCLERALQLAPSDATVIRNWGRCLLGAEPWQGLLPRFSEFSVDPTTCVVGLELMSSLLAAQGRTDELYELVGFETLVASYELEGVNGYDDLVQFNDALVSSAGAHADLDDRLAHGVRRSPNLLARGRGPLEDLERLVADAVTDYLARLPGTDHPFIEQMPALGSLDARAITVPAGACEKSEPGTGWLAGIYYAALPQARSRTELGILDAHGEPHPSPKLFCPPRAGRLILYPAFWCRTSRVEGGAGELVLLSLSMGPKGGAPGMRYTAR